MTDISLLTNAIRDILHRFPLMRAYESEQRDLQPHVQATLVGHLSECFPGASLSVNISVGGTGKPSLKLLGTSFWPDVEILDGGTPIAAIETKLIRPHERASKAIAEAIGQSVIYRLHYPTTFALVVCFGHTDLRSHDEDAALSDFLRPLNVELVLRPAEAQAAA